MNPLGTVRGRLAVGFGVTMLLLLAGGVYAILAFRRASAASETTVRTLASGLDLAQRASVAILREVAAGMQMLNTRDTTDERRYAALAQEADSLRRFAVSASVISE